MASIFTRIINGEIPCYKVAEDDRDYAFLDISPMAKGHTLVVPKVEVDYLFDLDPQVLAGMAIFAQKVAKGIEAAIPCKRVGVAVLGMEVPHAHIHLVPLNKESDLDFRREKLKFSSEEFQAIAKSIAESIK